MDGTQMAGMLEYGVWGVSANLLFIWKVLSLPLSEAELFLRSIIRSAEVFPLIVVM